MESDHLYTHIRDFQVLCRTIKEGIASDETVCLTLFPFTLKDRAMTWLENLTPLSINTWAELQALFLKNFFPTHKTISLKNKIKAPLLLKNVRGSTNVGTDIWIQLMHALIVALRNSP